MTPSHMNGLRIRYPVHPVYTLVLGVLSFLVISGIELLFIDLLGAVDVFCPVNFLTASKL
jgi:hypothetical protein